MKIKEFGPRGRARVPGAPALDPPMINNFQLVDIAHHFMFCSVTVADPGFPERAAIPQGEGTNLLFGQIVSENCMKMK